MSATVVEFEPDGSGDEEKQSDLYLQHSYTARIALLIVLDCNTSMFERFHHPDTNTQEQDESDDDFDIGVNCSNRRIAFFMVMQALRRVLQVMALDAPSHLVGVVLYNTRESNYNHTSQSSAAKPFTSVNDHIYCLRELDETDPTFLSLISDLGNESAFLDEKIASVAACEGAKIAQVMTRAMQLLHAVKAKVAQHRILWITNQECPHSSDLHARKTAQIRFTDAFNASYEIAPYFIPPPDQSTFDLRPFWADVLGLHQDYDVAPVDDMPKLANDSQSSQVLIADTDHITISTKYSDLLAALESRELKKKTEFRIPFHLTAKTTVGVCGYALYAKASKVSEMKILAASNRPVAPAPTQLLCETTGKILNPDTETLNVYNYAGTAAKLTPQEVAVVKHGQPWDPSLRLLGFKSITKLKRTHNFTHSTFVYPDESAYSGSITALAALRHVMLQSQVFALVRHYPRRSLTPRFAALVPLQAQKASDGSLVSPSGFYLIPLPFRDELRRLSRPKNATSKSPSIEDAHLSEALEQLVNRWRAAEFNPKDFPNISITRMMRLLHAKALDQPELISSVEEDALLPDYEQWHERCAHLALKVKALVPQPKKPEPKTKRKRT